MSESMSSTNVGTITLRKSIKIYLICWAVLIGAITLANLIGNGGGWLLLAAYLGCGIYLNRAVLRKLIEWHAIYNTLENVSNAKLTAVVFWPFSYAFLFIRIAINKAL